ncbi:MAG: hypothetical protein IJB34_01375 [Clostridia bacterium]|nr:hypothetical protein [Clostridia bacterium]
MARICRKISFAILSFALSLLVVIAGLFPAVLPSVSASASTALTYEQTDVMDDLKQSTIDGEPFSLKKYGFNAFKDTQVLSLVEYCYSFYRNKQDNYGLYIYLYNPKGLNFDVNNQLNCVQMTYGDSTSTNYTKYPIRLLNYSTETNYERLFYKFKVMLTGEQKREMLETLNSSERVYRISGIELVQVGKTNATEFSVGTTYHYSGYAAGYGSNPDAENTLICDSEQAEVLTLNVHPTTYRPSGTNGKNNYTQDSLHSVYFAVPNDIIQRYGAMTAVHATWKNAVLAPSLVTGNESAYDAILPFVGKDMSTHNEDLNYMYLGAHRMSTATGMGSVTNHSYGYAFNRLGFWPGNWTIDEYYGDDVKTLYALYFAGSGTDSADNYTVSSEDILSKLKASKTQYGAPLVNDKYSTCMFESYDNEFTDVNIEADETFSLTSEKISKNWWDKLWNLKGDVSTTTFDGIEAIHAVTEEEVCKRLYISTADYDDFKAYYNENKALCTTYLFRYQTSDYISQEATLLKEGKLLWQEIWEEVDTNAYFFQQTVNLDFDIIDVTFSNGSVDTVIPVVSDPIDVVPDATAPVYTQSDKEPAWLRWLKIAIVTILIVVLVIVGWPILQPLFIAIGKGVVWLVTAPFKAIGNAIKKRKRKKEEQEENNGKDG